MSHFGKVYTLYKTENLDKFVSALPIPEELKTKLLTAKQSQKVVKNGDEYTITFSMDDESKDTVFKSGDEKDEKTRENVSFKNKHVVDGDSITQTMTFAPGSTITIKREFKGNELIVTSTSSKFEGEAKTYYKA